jgi:hypothetical protein
MMNNNGELICNDCPETEEIEEDQNNKIIIDENGVDIDIKGDGDNFKLKIDEKGVQIKANEATKAELKKDTVG